MGRFLAIAFLLTYQAFSAGGQTVPPTDEPFVQIEIPPQFRGGGMEEFRRWAGREFTVRCLRRDPAMLERRYVPEMPLGIRVVVGFDVDEQGRADSIRVLQTPLKELSDVAVAVVESSPRWMAGQRLLPAGDGTRKWRPARFRMMCPLDFRPAQRIVDSLSEAGIARMVRFEVPDTATFAQWVAGQVPDAACRDDVACMSDTVRVVFLVDTMGRVCEVRAEKYRYEGTRRCAERIVAASPRWLPALVEGKPVAAGHSVKVVFRSEEESVWYSAERMAKFEGGDLQRFREWVEERVAKRLDGNSPQTQPGMALLTFVLDTLGNVTDVEVLRGGNPPLDAAAVDAVRSSPRWTPAAQLLRPDWPCRCRRMWVPVRLKYTLPVRYRIGERQARKILKETSRKKRDGTAANR